MLGFGAVGIAIGDPVQMVLENALRPLTEADPTGIAQYLPTASRFRLYSVAGFNPDVSTDDYELVVDGLVERPLSVSYADLRARPQVGLTRDFQCVTGWRVADVEWAGVRVADLLHDAGVDPAATHVRFHSYDGIYTTTLTLDQARRDDVIVATAMAGDEPIRRPHGGPVRLYVAPMYGYKSLKWLSGIEVTDQRTPAGYWETRGYDADAWVGASNGRGDDPT